jgi:hypothetical protein
MSIREHGGAFRNHRLSKHALAQKNAPPRKPLSDFSGNRLVDHQTKTKQLRGNFTRHVIRRRSEATCDQKDVAA